jgi:hypothetical protein
MCAHAVEVTNDKTEPRGARIRLTLAAEAVKRQVVARGGVGSPGERATTLLGRQFPAHLYAIDGWWFHRACSVAERGWLSGLFRRLLNLDVEGNLFRKLLRGEQLEACPLFAEWAQNLATMSPPVQRQLPLNIASQWMYLVDLISSNIK